MDLFSSGLGQYVVQTTFHSVIIVTVVEAMIRLWHIQRPSLQIKFRLLVLLLPVLHFPFSFLLYSPRTDARFREQIALIDFNAWLGLRLGGGIAVWHLFAALLALTTVYFLVREASPSLGHYLGRRRPFTVIKPGQFPKLDLVLSSLAKARGLPSAEVLLSAENAPVIYTLGHRTLVLSATAINMLDDEELEAAIAHELAHLTGQAYRISQASVILRFLMFYNPVALLIFRRIINDSERNCDDIAVAATGKQLALASGLLRVLRRTPSSLSLAVGSRRQLPFRISALEHRAYRDMIGERVERLVHPDAASDTPYQSFRVLFTGGLLLGLLFFAV